MMNLFARRAAALAASVGFAAGVGFSSRALADSTGSKDPQSTAAASSLQRGRYLARIAVCNDCHTPGYSESGGTMDEKQWLIGSKVGWQGPWGTTYPSNLRLTMATRSEDEWVRVAKSTRYRPPMPWFALRDMTERDLRALYRFVISLGPAGEPAPAYVPPGQSAHGPVIAIPAPPKS